MKKIFAYTKPKILYVCPFAHHGGHRPAEILMETRALVSAGFDVTLLTFSGFFGDNTSDLSEHITLRNQKFFPSLVRLLNLMGRSAPLKNATLFFENYLTLRKAILLNRDRGQYDLIHVNDGDPFIFLTFLINNAIKNHRWALHVIFDPRRGMGKVNFANAWKPIYRRALARNRIVFLCENELITQEYEKVMGDLFHRKAVYFPLATQFIGNKIRKEHARTVLKLPKDKKLLLCFGSLHSGKDLKVVVKAVQNSPQYCVVIAGKASLSSIGDLKSIDENIIVRNYYISEEEKPLYYAAADIVLISYRKEFLERRSGAMLLDACKFESTIVASDGGQIGALVKKFKLGQTFEPENPCSLRQAIDSYSNLGLTDLDDLKHNCKVFCDYFSGDNWAERYKKLLHDFFFLA